MKIDLLPMCIGVDLAQGREQDFTELWAAFSQTIRNDKEQIKKIAHLIAWDDHSMDVLKKIYTQAKKAREIYEQT